VPRVGAPREKRRGGIVHEFADAKAISAQGEDAAPGDVAMALEKLVAIYRFIDDERRAP